MDMLKQAPSCHSAHMQAVQVVKDAMPGWW
jgi:hypothetical protein